MEAVWRAPVVGEEQEPGTDLRHEQRLGEHEQVRGQVTGPQPPPVDEAADEKRERRHREDGDGQGPVHR